MKTTSRRFVYIPRATDVVREQPASHNQQAETGNRATKRQWWRRLAVISKPTDCGLEGSILNKLPVEVRRFAKSFTLIWRHVTAPSWHTKRCRALAANGTYKHWP